MFGCLVKFAEYFCKRRFAGTGARRFDDFPQCSFCRLYLLRPDAVMAELLAGLFGNRHRKIIPDDFVLYNHRILALYYEVYERGMGIVVAASGIGTVSVRHFGFHGFYLTRVRAYP